MANSSICSVCVAAAEKHVYPNEKHSNPFWAELFDVSEASIRRHYKHIREGVSVKTGDFTEGIVTATTKTKEQSEGNQTYEASDGTKYVEERLNRKVTLDDARAWIRSTGDDPDDFNISVKAIEYGNGLYSNKMSAWPKHKRSAETVEDLTWVPVQPAAAVTVNVPQFPAAPLVGTWKTAVATADHQIGYRGTETFHDDGAISIAHAITAIEQPDQIIYCGDFLDLAEQGRFEQEAAFAGTTQRSIDRGHELISIDRALAPNAKIVLIEGNHDRRMEKFIATNAMSAHGLKRANVPETWPVMSIPNLLRLDELDAEYIDAYPAGMWWVNDNLRAIHGDKVRSNGSTASAYTNQLPHISTIFGHTHRTEIQSKTVLANRGEKIRSMSINPGCMCKVDGEVPSVKGSTGVDGRAARVVEDWQNGLAVIRYKDSGEFFVNLVQIENGVTVYNNEELRATA